MPIASSGLWPGRALAAGALGWLLGLALAAAGALIAGLKGFLLH